MEEKKARVAELEKEYNQRKTESEEMDKKRQREEKESKWYCKYLKS